MTLELPDYDELMALAKESPEKLEQLRQRHIEHIINGAPNRQRKRLRGLQFQIDCCRQLHTSPLGACIAISRMMHDRLNAFSQVFSEINHTTEETTQESHNAKIIPFRLAGS